jgi:hypothetical protein
MNDKLLEFQYKATEEVPSGKPQMKAYDLNAVKFAELIIEECAKVAFAQASNHEEASRVYHTILYHFGVYK